MPRRSAQEYAHKAASAFRDVLPQIGYWLMVLFFFYWADTSNDTLLEEAFASTTDGMRGRGNWHGCAVYRDAAAQETHASILYYGIRESGADLRKCSCLPLALRVHGHEHEVCSGVYEILMRPVLKS